MSEHLNAVKRTASIVPLYKCTRPDGTDFFTGTVNYAAALTSGEPLPELPGGDGEFPGPGWYHLADMPTACVGMWWPCRLFEADVEIARLSTADPQVIADRIGRNPAALQRHMYRCGRADLARIFNHRERLTPA